MFENCLVKYVIVFINAILAFSKNKIEHEQHLRLVLLRRREKQLYAKFKKWEFSFETLTFLGHVVSNEGIQVKPSKFFAIKGRKIPTNLGEMQSFLGLASYYIRFIQDFARIVSPLVKEGCKV